MADKTRKTTILQFENIEQVRQSILPRVKQILKNEGKKKQIEDFILQAKSKGAEDLAKWDSAVSILGQKKTKKSKKDKRKKKSKKEKKQKSKKDKKGKKKTKRTSSSSSSSGSATNDSEDESAEDDFETPSPTKASKPEPTDGKMETFMVPKAKATSASVGDKENVVPADDSDLFEDRFSPTSGAKDQLSEDLLELLSAVESKYIALESVA